MKHGKKWGVTYKIVKNENTIVCYIDIKKGGFSSKHAHEYWTNHFFVISGQMKIYQWTEEGFQDETILNAGESTLIPDRVKHKFEAMMDTKCIEVYTPPKMSDEDIIRDDSGGIKK